MTHVGIIGGTNLIHSKLFDDYQQQTVETDHGPVEAFQSPGNDVLIIPRHGHSSRKPPHQVNHHGNIAALQLMGVRHVIGITSVGSLSNEIPPGSFLVPDDYMQITGIPTFFHDDTIHITPILSNELRELILRTGRTHGFSIIDGGVYIQTTGPRFETRAEVRFFSGFGEVVGMNMASEATLAQELDMEYANLSVVDNYAHGLSGELSYESFMDQVTKHQESMDALLRNIISELQKTYK